MELCAARGLRLVEDAAQSLGVTLDGVHLGTFGDIGTFSLSSPKIISTGQGGIVVTRNATLARAIALAKNFGRATSGVGETYVDVGMNAKFTDLQAVVGIEQLKKLPARVARMRAMWERYYAGRIRD